MKKKYIQYIVFIILIGVAICLLPAKIGQTKIAVGFQIDRLTSMMMVVVTFVSLMVHIYTIGYMEDDKHNWPEDSRGGDNSYQRFFSYISLFTFSMLMLVMSNNFMQLFFGWEAVGLVY